jgi:hypothetical protein
VTNLDPKDLNDDNDQVLGGSQGTGVGASAVADPSPSMPEDTMSSMPDTPLTPPQATAGQVPVDAPGVISSTPAQDDLPSQNLGSVGTQIPPQPAGTAEEPVPGASVPFGSTPKPVNVEPLEPEETPQATVSGMQPQAPLGGAAGDSTVVPNTPQGTAQNSTGLGADDEDDSSETGSGGGLGGLR